MLWNLRACRPQSGWHALSLRRAWGGRRHALRVLLRACHLTCEQRIRGGKIFCNLWGWTGNYGDPKQRDTRRAGWLFTNHESLCVSAKASPFRTTKGELMNLPQIELIPLRPAVCSDAP